MTEIPDWDEATRAQVSAARPDTSTWLSANAGSGKTRVLTDRVARLLLNNVPPQHILCLTYTKAAASEMQNRLFKRLGAWAMMDDSDLRPDLRNLGILEELDDAFLRRARTLFAQAIETPGGLKIQTIHSFCAALLRRFPLEAKVSPQFVEIEERTAELLRLDIVEQMADGPDAVLLENVATYLTSDDISALTREICGNREAFDKPFDLAHLRNQLQVPDQFSPDTLAQDLLDPPTVDLLKSVLAVFPKHSSTMVGIAETVRRVDLAAPTAADFFTLCEAFLIKSAPFTPKKNVPTKDAAAELGSARSDALADLILRIAETRDLYLRVETLNRSAALHQFSERFTRLYEGQKQQRGWLDFDDLILRAKALLSDPKVAQWVLYRIDGGIDHILVDEAQDTSPRQWAVIDKLADEFSSGEGAQGDKPRTIFVVGDKKQSIYSFQGAAPQEFDHQRDTYRDKLQGAGQPFQSESLDYSFRSSAAILNAVDSTFGPGNDLMQVETKHIAFKDQLPGRVDLWPIVPPAPKQEKEKWTDPIDQLAPQHHNVELAQKIAAHIKSLCDGAHFIPDDGSALHRRPIRFGDFLILVQRRSGIFPEIIKACKALKLPIAGADRLKVGAELAVRDIAALLSFLATPEDSLSLATALKSPLFGWSEKELYALAHHRTERHLWQSLRTQTEAYPDTVRTLQALRDQIDFLRPYDLIESILTKYGGRAKLLARLGKEAEDGIDALLGQALSYERTAIPSLTGFLNWLETDDLEIKRQIDSASDQIRVMTVHGAKGLEAPIVILPDTVPQKKGSSDAIIDLNGSPIWAPGKDKRPDIVSARLEALGKLRDEERMRLLYVAMTRAEKWLIVAAAGDAPKDGSSWYQFIERGLSHLPMVPFDEAGALGQRYQENEWDGPPKQIVTPQAPHNLLLETVFETKLAQTPIRKTSLSPSDLGGAKAMPGDDGEDEETALSYGTLVHLLLERLAEIPDSVRAAAGSKLTAGPVGAEALAEALAVLRDPSLAWIFADGSLAEVAVTAALGKESLYGVIDRLIFQGDKVIAIDFKTNKVVPSRTDQVPGGLLVQMGAYSQALAQIYPDKIIETAILWTRTCELMPLPHDIVRAALERTPHLDGTAPAS